MTIKSLSLACPTGITLLLYRWGGVCLSRRLSSGRRKQCDAAIQIDVLTCGGGAAAGDGGRVGSLCDA